MSKKKPSQSRRDFLKLAGTSAPAAVAALAVGADKAEASDAQTSSKTLRKTGHVKQYLASARF